MFTMTSLYDWSVQDEIYADEIHSGIDNGRMLTTELDTQFANLFRKDFSHSSE